MLDPSKYPPHQPTPLTVEVLDTLKLSKAALSSGGLLGFAVEVSNTEGINVRGFDGG
jgi:hypothetical protein